MGFQSGVEGDYYGYFDEYNEIQQGVPFLGHETEMAWFFLNKTFSFVSFPVFIFIISVLQYLILSNFVKKFVSKPYQYIGAILFYFTFSFMLLQMKAIRQGLAVEFSIMAFIYVDNKNIWKPVFLILAAYCIHNSSIIIAPFIIWYHFSKKFSWFERKILRKDFFYPILWTAIFLIVYSLKEVVLNNFLYSKAYTMEILRFSGYLNDIKFQFDISWLIVSFDALMVFTLTWFYKFASPTMRFFSVLAVIAAFSDMLLFGLGTLPRIFLYFSIFNVVVYPNVAQSIARKFGYVVSFVYIVISVGYAFKTSLPWMLETIDGRFGSFKFIFQ